MCIRMVTGLWDALKVAFNITHISKFNAFHNTVFTTITSKARRRTFIVRLINFSILDLSLILNRKFPI